ncbi:MAG: hypothetical protein E7202_07780 [Selenomonas ruminantium]|nr:hypothetical protein [Selenomonas ruminantium]
MMADRRKTQKNHIRAARDWLGEAEHSLEHENDIQGDLKLMLARAELSQVQDSPRCAWLKCWARRLLPPVVAVLLVTAGLMAGGRLAGDDTPPVPAAPAGEDTAETANVTPAVAEEPPQQQAEEKASAVAADTETAGAKALELPAEPVASPEKKAAVPVQEPVPDAQKQRLMQSAGKILRQQ